MFKPTHMFVPSLPFTYFQRSNALRSSDSRALRWQSLRSPTTTGKRALSSRTAAAARPSPLSRLSTPSLIRGVLLGTVFTSKPIFKLGLSCLSWIANSKSWTLNPDRNPLLKSLIRPLLYDHFCAGTNAAEVGYTIANIKKMGFAGVILCYGKEIVVEPPEASAPGPLQQCAQDRPVDKWVDEWLDGNMKTLAMVGEGDYIGIKLTGAGPSVTKTLIEGGSPTQQLLDALDVICNQAAAQGSKLWVDAEQQALQPTIEKWTIELMRRYNRNGQALVSTTIQAYLKNSRVSLAEHLRLAQEEGWSLGLKLVRGAYIGNDARQGIHDNKADTDASYDGIVREVLTKKFPGFDKSTFPDVHLFLAGHNTESIRRASTLARDLVLAGEHCGTVKFGQLQGMADDISCELLQLGDDARISDSLSDEEIRAHVATTPQAYKCLTWGSVQECMQYLVRRAVENQGAAARMSSGTADMKRELARRILPF